MSDPRMFPVSPAITRKGAMPHPIRVPWSVAEKAYAVYAARYGRDQSLERLAERGGFAAEEMDDYYPGWRVEASEIESLKSKLDEAGKLLGAVCVIATLRGDEDLATPPDHAATQAVYDENRRANRAEAALDRLRWRPKASAPKNDPVLVALIRDGKIWRVSDAVRNDLSFYTVNGGNACHWVTHWMPMPEAGA